MRKRPQDGVRFRELDLARELEGLLQEGKA